MRWPLLPPVDEVGVLDGLHDREVNYDPARAPEGGRPEGHWHVDSSATQRYYRAVQRRLYELVQAAQRGEPLPTPADGRNGLILAPTGARPSPAERLAPRWVHPGA